jgi:integrase
MEPVSDVLNEYLERHAAKCRRPDLIAFASARLSDFFTHKCVSAVTQSSCSDYVEWRIRQGNALAIHNPKPVKSATARRELVVLGAALSWCWKAGKLDRLVPVSLPPQAEPRERHLTQAEAVRLIAGALGFYRQDGRWRRAPTKINRHVARFIMLGLYTGTRHDAILRLRWQPNRQGGWIDLDAGVLYRRPFGAVESAKRRPPIPIPLRLAPPPPPLAKAHHGRPYRVHGPRCEERATRLRNGTRPRRARFRCQPARSAPHRGDVDAATRRERLRRGWRARHERGGRSADLRTPRPRPIAGRRQRPVSPPIRHRNPCGILIKRWQTSPVTPYFSMI